MSANKYFLKTPYMDGTNDPYDDEFRRCFIAYLEGIIANYDCTSLNEYRLFLQGGKQALQEVVDELKGTF